MKVILTVLSAIIGIIIGVLLVKKYRPEAYNKAFGGASKKVTSWKSRAKETAGVVVEGKS